ncbi:MAG TPA: MerR family transcriptional regulator [Tahibacter sp.]|uniref:MerR family transcriptional regulator n=1 Tax=Tahibacter sp. TaxID=2056211 RepID=UPI002C38D679|nr:MerR family transcriptional regulator [Tahibacter sp.]HSX60747.1 MerR family transcriptional regulator [Tahibacter sp.]
MSKTGIHYLRIGDLARRSGVSAKALRLYESRGLLKPAAHSAAGYRLYDAAALVRLNQIVLLKRAGFRLAEIGRLLARDPQAATQLLRARIATLERECAERAQVLGVLRGLAARAVSPSEFPLDELVETIAMSTQLNVDWSERERDDFRRRAEQLGETGMAEAQRLWPELIAQVRAAMDAGTSADAPEVQEYARRWYALLHCFTGGDAEVTRKLGQAWQSQPAAMAAHGLDPALFAYVGTAMKVAGLALPGLP